MIDYSGYKQISTFYAKQKVYIDNLKIIEKI